MAMHATFISPDESDFIRFQLALANRPSEIKAGLQRLCALYEYGKRLLEPDEHRLSVMGLLLDKRVIIRRWAYKAIAWLGTNEDVSALIRLFGTESNSENRTWAVAAIIALDKDQDVGTVCTQSELYGTQPLLLAARLFAHEHWLKQHPDTPIINIDLADPLTLKWASLLSGYGRAPDNLFHPRHENRALLGKLNTHPEPEVAEYSVWALWQNPGYVVGDMAIKIDQIGQHPKNVRRWINRLITKTDTYLASNIDLIDDLRQDQEPAAREGLALGLRTIFVTGLGRHVLDWHDVEQEDIIREILVEHMAANAGSNTDYATLVEEKFRKAGRDSGIRKRILAASVLQPLHANLKQFEARERASDAGLEQTTLIFVEKANMTNIRAGRDIIAQNIVGGDMINSANEAVQRLDKSREVEKRTLGEILDCMKTSGIADDHKKEIAAAAQRVAIANTNESKHDLATILTKVAQAVGAASVLGTQLHNFAHVVATWLAS